MKRVCCLIVGVLLVALLAPLAIGAIETTAVGQGRKTDEELILELQNAYRVQAGMEPLVLTEELEAAADVRAVECAYYFSHTRPDGRDWWTVDPATVYGENLSNGYAEPEDIVAAWLTSRSHRFNLLNPEYATCGIEMVYANGRWYCAEVFGY